MRMLGSVAMPKSLELFWMKNNSDLDRISSSSGTRTRTRKRSLQQRQLRAIIRLSMIQPYSDRFWFLSLRYIHAALVPGCDVSFGTNWNKIYEVFRHLMGRRGRFLEAFRWSTYRESQKYCLESLKVQSVGIRCVFFIGVTIQAFDALENALKPGVFAQKLWGAFCLGFALCI